ncbi:MAG TPA: FAD binding domain-containing protein [Burkholderiales bacterium]|nr:FAD binding domain-containing protein [Burkholderiales bacterium]
MKAPRFAYEKPRSLDAAIRLLAAGGDGAKLIAGGQSLGPILNFRLAQPELLIDVRTLPELAAVRDEGDAVFLGAATTHAAIEDVRVPDPTRGLLPAVARTIAYRAVRNRGTLGGSLAHADPAADWVSVMVLLDAEIVAQGPRGERRIRASAFVRGPLTTALAADEIITGVRVPKLSPRARWGHYKFNRKPGEFAEAIGGFVHDPERGVARAIIGAIGDAPHVLADGGPFVKGFDPAAAESALDAAGLPARSYERQVHLVALKRAVAQSVRAGA